MTKPTSDINEVKKTKDRIMFEAAILFAKRGYAAVAVRDIADKVNIKASSLYNHFSGKEALFEAILDNISDIYMQFYKRMEERTVNATSYKEVLDCLFLELNDIYDIFIYYGVGLITTEQFRDEKARVTYSDVFLRVGIEYAEKQLMMCVEKGWVKPFDTGGLAAIFMNSVAMGSLMRVHENMGHDCPYEINGMYKSLYDFMLNAVQES